VYELYIQYIYTVQVCVLTSGIVVLCIERGCQFPDSRKYAILNENFVFDLHDIFQEHNSGVKRDLLVI
jgi:hypothetical protein